MFGSRVGYVASGRLQTGMARSEHRAESATLLSQPAGTVREPLLLAIELMFVYNNYG